MILPCLILTDRERGDLETNPNEFVSYSLDSCDQQESYTLKCGALKLLENLADNIDGALTFVAQVAAKLLVFGLHNGTLDEIPTKYPQLAEIVNTKFFTTTNYEEKADSALICLINMSYHLSTRLDIHQLVSTILLEQADPLTLNATNLIKARTIHLLTYIYELIFTDPNLLHYKLAYTKFMINCLNPGPGADCQSEAVSLQACEAFKAILINRPPNPENPSGPDPIIPQVIGTVIDTMIDMIPTITYEPFFDIMMTLAKSYPAAILETAERYEKFVTNLVNRSLRETEAPTDPSKKDMFVIRTWNAIRTLSESKLLVEKEDCLAKYDLMLAPAWKTMAEPMSICFDDDVLDILIAISKSVKTIPPNLAAIIQYFPQILTKYKGHINQLLVTYNAYFNTYKQVFDNKEILDMTIGNQIPQANLNFFS